MRRLLPLLLLPACSGTSTAPLDPHVLSFLQVELTEPFEGTEDSPAPFSAEDVAVQLRVEALDRNADPLDVDALLTVKAKPGTVTSDDHIQMEGGVWEGTVTLRYGYGPTRIWIADDLEKDQSREHTWVAGVSDALWFRLPTVAELQATDDHETNPLEGDYAELRCEDRQLVVTAVGTDGFWLADLASPHGEYDGLFVYTFNRPAYSAGTDSGGGEAEGESPGVEVGDRLASLAGCDQEYLATTQLSFPTYTKAEDGPYEVPDPIRITDAELSSDDAMEKLESLLVEVDGGTIPSDFQVGSDSEDYQDYVDYGQWPLQVGDETIYVESSTIPDFFPTEHAGETLEYVRGMLSEVWGKWIIQPRDASDLSLTAAQPFLAYPTDDFQPSRALRRLKARPRSSR